MSDIVAVGAGVIGLSTGLTLSEAGHEVRVIAANFPNDPFTSRYSSSWDGADYRPFLSHTEKDYEEAKLTRATYEYFRQLAVEAPKSAVKWIKRVVFVEDKGIYGLNSRSYYEGIEDLKGVPKSQLPKGANFAASYES